MGRTTVGLLNAMFKERFNQCKLRATKNIVFFNKLTGEQLSEVEKLLKNEINASFHTKIVFMENKGHRSGEIYYKKPLGVR